jgi:diguanylate cyclase (GGDEF)-like protein/PAS domain S-box-containing protein
VLDGTLNNLTDDPAIGAVVVNFRDITSTRRAEQLRALEHGVNRCLADAESVAQALKTVIRAICETERWECGRFFKPDEEAGVLRCVEHWGIPGDRIDRFIERSRGLEYGPSEGLAGRVWQSGQPVWVADVTNEPRVSTRLGPDAGMRGAFVFPIMSDGRTIGVLAFNSSEVREPDAPLLQAVGVIGSQIGQWLRRKYAEEELLRFRASMDLSGDMIVLIDRATMRFADVNDTACKLLGYSREELLGMGPQDILPESRDELARIYDEMIASPSSHDSMKSRYLRKDGSSFPFESTRRVLRSGDGWVIVAISRDISERIASEAALRESNERFDSAVRATNDVIWDWNLATGELWWNENLAKVFGYRLEDIDRTNKFWEDNIHPADRQRVASGVDNAIKSGEENWGDEYRFRRRDGTYAFVYDRGRLIRDDSGKPVRMIGAMADVTARKEAEERLSYLAQFDTLTNLPNRHLFRDRLAQTLVQGHRGHGQVGVMFVDLDRFKNINDMLGHEAGDRLLVLAAASLNESVREGDTVARISGDEFAIVLANMAKAEDASIVAGKVINGFAHSFDVAGHKVYVTASIGISVYPNDGADAETLLKNSETAMHRAKEQGRNGYQFYLPAMNERAMHRLELETGLRVALERKEFLLHYQPKIDLASNSICGFEALLRWQHPERGLIPPVQFIPILEDTGLIVPVGEWVLLQACREIEAWRTQGIEPRPVAVNLSARQFQQKNLDEVIGRVLKDTGIDPAHLELELTESLLMHDAAEAARTLQNLKNYGVRLAVDDFGTGYSSLAYLRRFPIDALKVDRAFIRDLTTNAEDATITLAIINLAHSLKLGVVAEGVETSAQVTFLKENRCDEAQGFYFARPLGIEECTKTLVEKRRFH